MSASSLAVAAEPATSTAISATSPPGSTTRPIGSPTDLCAAVAELIAPDKAALLAGILSSSNVANFGLLVSTNYINYSGFYNLGPNDNPLTNVNYEYQANGNPLTPAQFLQNLANLYYGARPPVYVTNRSAPNSNEFRYYLDLNRNGHHEVSGLWPAISDNPALPYYDTNGQLRATIIFGNTLSNYVQGDPEWQGVLDRPNQPHGPENQFISRFTYMVVPVGKTLDVNYGFNNAKPGNLVNGYIRNQGVGSWEINHAAFFADLNTNLWNSIAFSTYNYLLAGSVPNLNLPSTGAAFDDAYSLWLWRRGGARPASALGRFHSTGGRDAESDDGARRMPLAFLVGHRPRTAGGVGPLGSGDRRCLSAGDDDLPDSSGGGRTAGGAGETRCRDRQRLGLSWRCVHAAGGIGGGSPRGADFRLKSRCQTAVCTAGEKP